MDSLLGMALQLPALKSICEQIGVDLSNTVEVGPRLGAAPPPTAGGNGAA
jgi:hypothetical protein